MMGQVTESVTGNGIQCRRQLSSPYPAPGRLSPRTCNLKLQPQLRVDDGRCADTQLLTELWLLHGRWCHSSAPSSWTQLCPSSVRLGIRGHIRTGPGWDGGVPGGCCAVSGHGLICRLDARLIDCCRREGSAAQRRKTLPCMGRGCAPAPPTDCPG